MRPFVTLLAVLATLACSGLAPPPAPAPPPAAPAPSPAAPAPPPGSEVRLGEALWLTAGNDKDASCRIASHWIGRIGDEIVEHEDHLFAVVPTYCVTHPWGLDPSGRQVVVWFSRH